MVKRQTDDQAHEAKRTSVRRHPKAAGFPSRRNFVGAIVSPSCGPFPKTDAMRAFLDGKSFLVETSAKATTNNSCPKSFLKLILTAIEKMRPRMN